MKDENISDRSIKQIVSNSMKSGGLKITKISSDDNEIECNEDIGGPCESCGKRIEHALDSYSYLVINSPDYVSVDEKMFCCKKCWEEYLVKEAKRSGL